ncbi:potassium channel family protein [Nocardioides sp. Soil805]|uniref:potassium channel family protein n=1 Tax=Nocardioides sp. Soil805 TaxID=1736416 RepID=UPI000AE7E62D|nr:potassium channel family protein [Nocardioides sp. Soil805]
MGGDVGRHGGTGHQAANSRRTRRLLLRALLTSLASAVVLVGLYYAAPLDRLERVPVVVSFLVGLGLFSLAVAWQLWAIAHATYPGLRAVEGLGVIVPFFLVLYSTAYAVLAQDDAASFSTSSLTRTDTMYFTITVFATVGFGDITATSQAARVLVMTQMLLDLVFLGLGVRLLVGVVNLGRKRQGKGPGLHAGVATATEDEAS